MTIDLNPQFVRALDLMENSPDSLFITGRAGTGKSTLLQYFKKTTQKNIVTLAPTGVAAVNIGGATIHSFFQFKPDVTLEKAWAKGGKPRKPELYRNLDAIVIDGARMIAIYAFGASLTANDIVVRGTRAAASDGRRGRAVDV